jgi:hypothetical protein
MIEEVYKVPEKPEWSLDTAIALNKALSYLYEKALTIEYTDTAPTLVPYGTFIIFDDGGNERIYFKTAEGTVAYVEAV